MHDNIAILITVITAVLILTIALLYIMRVRRLERAGGRLIFSPAEKRLFPVMPGVIIGILLCKWFYGICDLRNTIFSTAPLIRQFADFVCIFVFVSFCVFAIEQIRIFERRRTKRRNNKKPENA